jgi:hypothetical protein
MHRLTHGRDASGGIHSTGIGKLFQKLTGDCWHHVLILSLGFVRSNVAAHEEAALPSSISLELLELPHG